MTNKVDRKIKMIDRCLKAEEERLDKLAEERPESSLYLEKLIREGKQKTLSGSGID